MRTFAKRESDAKEEEAYEANAPHQTDTPLGPAGYAVMIERRNTDVSGFAWLASTRKR
jgi:hypothetical protein